MFLYAGALETKVERYPVEQAALTAHACMVEHAVLTAHGYKYTRRSQRRVLMSTRAAREAREKDFLLGYIS